MRENNRNSIEKCRKKLPQFTTMNVIDGQAGLVIYSSLIFYSLTIDNILNIIVLLILAGVSIAMLTGENGILTQAEDAKNETEKAGVEEAVDIAMAEYYMRKNAGEGIELGDYLNEKLEAGEFDNVTDNGDGTYTVEKDGYEVIVNEDGRQGEAQKAGPRPTVENVKVVLNSDGTGANLEEGTQPEGTKLYINFGAKIEGGTIKSVTSDNGTEVKETNGTYTMEVSKNGKYKFTIVGTVGGEEYTTTYTVEVKQYEISLKVGDYVRYGITYTDMYTDYEFTEENGWRVLDPGTENPDGTYTGVKLISTGLPAYLYYYGADIKSKETDKTSTNPGTVGKWAGNRTQRQNYLDLFNPANSIESDPNVYAATGLYYNFELIKFVQGSTSAKNVGAYKQIGTNTSGEISGEEFKVEGVAEEVHNLTLAELNKARGESETSTTSTRSKDGATGLFYLRELKEYGYSSEFPYYWLASPKNEYFSKSNLNIVSQEGYIQWYDNNTLEVRPVVSLKSNIEIEEVEI